MQIEDLLQEVLKYKNKLSDANKEIKDLRAYTSKYHNIDISELHKHIRNLENQLDMFKNNQYSTKVLKEGVKICSV